MDVPPQPSAVLPPAPVLVPMAHVECDVAPVVSLGIGPAGERRYVPLLGGTVAGPELSGRIVEGGVDWQLARADGALEIAAHYAVRTGDGALVEIRSEGLRHGPAEVMQRLARGEPVRPDEYYFRTVIRFTTGAAAWMHLNRTIAIAVGRREAAKVVLDFYRLA